MRLPFILQEEEMKKVILFSTFVLIGLLVVSTTGGPLYAAIPASERAALIALYNSTNGDGWRNIEGWKTPPLYTDGFAMPGTENTWTGITVSDDHVTEIELFSHNLSGSIPPELGNLSMLEELILGDDQLSGSIPPELGNLYNLEILCLGLNRLSGSIPPELGNLNKLEELRLGYNQLSGIIPPELGNLYNLEFLWLDSNRLSGIISPELGNLSNLRGLYLGCNQLSGSIPPELGNLSDLVFLYLQSNRLIGNIPSSLANLTDLALFHTYINYNGLYTNDEMLRIFLNSKNWWWEDSQTIAPANVSAAAISNSSIRVSWPPIIYTGDTGGYKVYYNTTSGGGNWTYSGMTTDKYASFFNVTGLSAETTYYFVIKTQTDPNNMNSNTVVSDYSEEISAATSPPYDKDPPFGSFETPIDGSTVAGSIPVTGWTLDDSGVKIVKIYREQGNEVVYIGDATFVEGARPDVAENYPGYPNNTRAGWGYMMLTHFLPNYGNGTFVIHAIATDIVGRTTTLGTKTITCDNVNAVKPFGAIDTPMPGGETSGSSFKNQGWILTPLPNKIPEDGSTIAVYVDGVNLGHATYNIYRQDIASLFPSYANSNGALGYFYLDTTPYPNGVHIIHWTAEDNGGNADGIGSRYFSIRNSHGARNMAHGTGLHAPGPVRSASNIPTDYSIPVQVKKGFNQDDEPRKVLPDETGMNRIVIKELERIEVYLSDQPVNSYSYSGYMKVGGRLKALPIGSTLDAERGIFYWLPGPGFLGRYHLVFIQTAANGEMTKKNIAVEIVPKTAVPDE